MEQKDLQIIRSKNEMTGVRVVSQYVTEFWGCGWQDIYQRNDKGLDGKIFLRKRGKDLGVEINVQIKCGIGFISSETDDEIKLSISNDLQGHINYWRQQLQPTILVFVNPYIPKLDNTGKQQTVKVKTKSGIEREKKLWKENRLRSKAYWINLKGDIYEGASIVKLKKSNRFGEHSMGEIARLARPLLSNLVPIVKLKPEYEKLLLSFDVRSDAKTFYKNWKSTSSKGFWCKSLQQWIIISRTGWNHITSKKRGKERRFISLHLLGAAKQIIEDVDNFYLLQQKTTGSFVEQTLGIRARIETRNSGVKDIQVIIFRRKDRISGRDKFWFYSVHYRK